MCPSYESTINTSVFPRPPLRPNPYARLGLSGNPFQVIDDPVLLRQVVTPALANLADELIMSNAPLIEVVGERGWGKSTLLSLIRAAGEHLSQRRWAWSYIKPEQRRITLKQPSQIGWIIDEAQRLSPAVQRRIVRLAKQGQPRIVLGTHDSFAQLAASEAAPLRTIQLAAPSGADLQAMLAARVSAFASEPVQTVLSEYALQLAQQFTDGNRRMFEELMYEVFCGFAREGRLPAVISVDVLRAGIAAHTWS